MKIACPISSADEVEMLAENGAGEFYCGLTPPEWLERYNVAIWLNRRSPKGANLLSYDALGTLVDSAQRYSIPVSLTLNAHHYTEDQLTLVLELARRASGLGVAALIVADPALMLALREAGIETPLHVSSLGACFGAEAAGFYQELGASRVILPRDLGLTEMARLVASAGPDIEWEAFVLNDGCPYTEGFCLTTHSVGDAFCHREQAYTFHSATSRLASVESGQLEEQYRDYRDWVWHVGGGCTVSHRGLQNGACGLCAIAELADIGVTAIKISGRQAPAVRKLVSLKLVRAVIDKLGAGAPPEEAAAFAKALRDTPDLCDSSYMCYYRDVAG